MSATRTFTRAVRDNHATSSASRFPSDAARWTLLGLVLLMVAGLGGGGCYWYVLTRFDELRQRERAVQVSLAMQLVAAIVDHAQDEQHDPRAVVPLANSAVRQAQSLNLVAESAEALLVNLPMPQALPDGTQLEIMSARSSPPAGVIDLRIVDSSGQPIQGLSRTDVELFCDDQRQRFVKLAQMLSSQQSLNVAIVLDASTSIQGAAFDSAIVQIRQIMASLSPTARFRIWSFASEVRPLGEWSSDVAMHNRALTNVQAGGATMLHDALRMSAEDLAKQPGVKVIILFTDGRDSLKAESGDAGIAICWQHGINVHVSALQSVDVDKAYLQRLAAETNGTFHLSAQPTDLQHVSQTILKAMRLPTHRLVTLGDYQTGQQCQLQVGPLKPVEFVWQ